MIDRAALIAAIETELKPAISPSISSAQSASDLYEAYLLTLVHAAARAEKAKITFRNTKGAAPGPFVFRTSPGLISSSVQDYTYVHIDVGSRRGQLEAHIGVRVSGRSRVLHEGDVIVLLASEADRARAQNTAPRSHAVLFLAEAKFYATPIPLGLGRAYLGLCSDLSVKRACLASTTENPSVTQLLDARGFDHEPNLTPGSAAAERFVGELRRVFDRHRRAA